MKRTTIVLPDDVDAQFRYEAGRRGVSLTELAREAIAAYVIDEPKGGRDLSIFDLGEGDLGEGDLDSGSNVDHYVAEAMEQRFRDDRR